MFPEEEDPVDAQPDISSCQAGLDELIQTGPHQSPVSQLGRMDQVHGLHDSQNNDGLQKTS